MTSRIATAVISTGLALSLLSIYAGDTWSQAGSMDRSPKTFPSRQRRGRSIADLLGRTPAGERCNLQARISYLRKKNKHDLIAKVLTLEKLIAVRDEEAMRLRDEIKAYAETFGVT